MLIRKELLSIGEVAQVTGIPVHTIRFWEGEFSRFISPARTAGRQRRYSESEVNRILEIKKLLKEDKYSIAGAKQVLSTQSVPGHGLPGQAPQQGQTRTGQTQTGQTLGLDRTGREPIFAMVEVPLG